MRKLLILAALFSAMLPMPAAFAHGHGGDSSACSDGKVPGFGFESGSLGSIGPVGIGAQGGTEPAVDHQSYSDICARVDGPTLSLPIFGTIGIRQGAYTSVRVHSNPDNCSELIQYIFTPDSDSTVKAPAVNTCRYG